MQALQIDFAARTPIGMLLAASPATLAGMVLGLLLTLGALLSWQQLPAPPRPVPPIPARQTPPTATLTAAQAAAVNRALLQLNLPWHDLLDALERASPASVALLALSPDAASRRLTGEAETRDSKAMLDYLARLQQQPFFRQVLLVRHERQEASGPRPLRFVFEARWGDPLP